MLPGIQALPDVVTSGNDNNNNNNYNDGHNGFKSTSNEYGMKK